MKNPLLAFHHWMMTDWNGNVPKHFLTGSMSAYSWQWPVLAGFFLGIAVFVYIALAASGAITWFPF